MAKLEGKHAIITGGGRGIGAATAEFLAREGAQITLMGRSGGPLHAHAGKLRALTKVQVVEVDVTDAESVETAFVKSHSGFGPAAILVNNAGQAASAPFGKTELALWHQMLDVNLTGTFLCIQAVLPGMLGTGFGRIVNIASTAGLVGYRHVAAYCAAKHGVIGLTRALALELARKNITVNAVCPGYTDTDMVRAAIANITSNTGGSEDEAMAHLTRSNPQGRLVRPEEVANAVSWLCDPVNDAITGQAISVSGGEVM